MEDGSHKQVARIAEGAGRQEAQSRDTKIELFERLAMGGAVPAPPAHRRADHQRDPNLVVVHPAEFGDVVDQLVGDQGDEIAEHDFDDRPQAAQRHPRRQPDHPRLGHRGRQDTPGKGRGQPAGDFESPAIRVQDILSQDNDALVVGERLMQGGVEAFEDGGHR